jgi:hypothetical protein
MTAYWPYFGAFLLVGGLLWIAIRYGRLAERDETKDKLLEVKQDAKTIDEKVARMSAIDKRKWLRRHRNSRNDN